MLRLFKRLQALVLLSFIAILCLDLSCAANLHDNNEDGGVPLKIIKFLNEESSRAKLLADTTNNRREVQSDDVRQYPSARSFDGRKKPVKMYRFGGH